MKRRDFLRKMTPITAAAAVTIAVASPKTTEPTMLLTDTESNLPVQVIPIGDYVYAVDPALVRLDDLVDPKPGKIVRMRMPHWGKGVPKNAIVPVNR